MTWTADRCYLEGLGFFTGCVHQLGERDWSRPSPCAGWAALDVLGHVGVATRFGMQLLSGTTPEWAPVDPPGEAVTGSPTEWWDALVEPARAAVDGVDLSVVVDSPMGRRSIGEGLSFPAIDLFVHGWDLVRCIGRSVEIPGDAIAFAHAVLQSVPAAMMRSSRVFATEREAPAGATPTDAFLAWTGRDPAWSASPPPS